MAVWYTRIGKNISLYTEVVFTLLMASKMSMSNKRKVISGALQARKRARNAPSIPTIVKRELMKKMELKCCDYSLSAPVGSITDDVTATTDAVLVNGLAVGSGHFNRVGRKIFQKSLRLRGLLTQVSSAGTGALKTNKANAVRMVVVLCKTLLGGVPKFDDIFGIVDNTGTASAQYDAPVRPSQAENFKVLRDVEIEFNPMGFAAYTAGPTGNQMEYCRTFDEYIPLKDLSCDYSSGSTGAIADISTGAILVYFRAQEGQFSGAGADVNGVTLSKGFARLRYYDA